MLQIPIDDTRYHGNILTEKELRWGEDTYCKLTARYKDLVIMIDKAFAPLYLSKQQKKKLLTDITIAFSHYAKVNLKIKTEDELYALLKKCFSAFLPYIVKNISSVCATHLVQYEPITVANIYVSTLLKDTLTKQMIGDDADKFTLYAKLDVIAFLRSVHSMIFLLTIGDDAHGMSLFRGALELLSKLSLAESFSEEYVLFKDFNIYLQDSKHNKTPLPDEMNNYLKNEKDFEKNKENFLAYGWARNKKQKRILTMRELLSESLGNNTDIALLFQFSSEFVHEDYSYVAYDYVAIRKYLTDVCFYLYRAFLMDVNLVQGYIPASTLRKINHVLRLAKPYYRGDFSLDEN